MTSISVAGKTIADFPEFAKEWDVKKNNNLNPNEVKAGSHIRGWWKCKEGHQWQTTVNTRLRHQTGCRKCRKGFYKPKAGKSLGDLYPELVEEWDFERNGKVTPYDIKSKVNVKFFWICKQNPKHTWDAEASSRTRGRGCPYCAKGTTKVLPPDSLAGKYPTLMRLWDYEKNKNISPEKVRTHSSKSFWWKCSKGEDHRWQQKPSVMVGNFTIGFTKRLGGCPFCDGKRVSKTNSLAQLYPDIAKFWHPEKNSMTPDEITAKSDKRVWWFCDNCNLEWQTSPKAKTQHGVSECPECQLKHISKTEVRIAHEVKAFFECEFGTKTWIRGKEKKWDVDILIRQLGLVIEFDGAYYHQNNHKRDARKTEDLQKNGFTVIRIRETHPKMPLEKITENDIQIATESSIKDISNKLLKQIEKVCNISIDGLNDYLVKKEAVNKSSANEYIARLLKDKHQTTLM